MKEYSLKHSNKQKNARQAAREARKAANRRIAPDRIAAIHVLPSGEEVVFHNPVSIPGYTYSF